MPVAQELTRSIWMDVPPLVFPPLSEDRNCDVCIVGAGIAGLTTAYLLTQAGLKVVVVDGGSAGGGQTSRTSAHLASAVDDRYFALERIHGAEGARTVADSHSTAIDLIESIVQEHAIPCDFQRVDGYLCVAPGESGAILELELQAAQRAGLAVNLTTHAPLADFDTGPCLCFPRQAQFHPLQYLRGLAAIIEESGGEIFGGSLVCEVQDGKPCKIRTEAGATVSAEFVVMATNTPVNDRLVLHSKQAAFRSYVIALPIPAASVPAVLLWDTADPYHYARIYRPPSGSQDVLIVGGEDHKTGQSEDAQQRFERLEAWARARFPVRGAAIARWSGQVMEPVDGVAFIGRNPGDERVLVTTGDSGNGLTHGTLAGILLRDLILGRTNPWSELYDPRRKRWQSLREYSRQNLNVAAQYTAYLKPGDLRTAADLAPDQGGILRQGAEMLALYRDTAGVLHACRAQCPHLGCIVAWNSIERSWDCPCHGSRFSPKGQLMNGPAPQGLQTVSPPD